MESQDFRDFGKFMIDYVADYNESLREREVLPNVQPGYLLNLLPKQAPEVPESWKDLVADIENKIMPGITHWNSPHFHAYYPTANSYPAIVGEILSAGIGCIGFSWIASPACTELEMITMDWLGQLLGLPKKFLNSDEGPGGGVLQGSASEATLVGLLASREITVSRIKEHSELDEGTIRSKLVAYTSDQSNSSVEKSGRLGSMLMRLLPTDDNCSLRGETLLKFIKKDIEDGLIPCFVVATLGTTPTCAFDNLDEIGPICKEYNIWLHIDAAYAGAAFVCPEYRYLMSGVQYADSFNFNPHKWLLVNFDCSALWVKDARHLTEAFNVERIYLADNKKGTVPDFRHWQIPLGRRFRALKLWFVLRLYGAEGLRTYIRRTIELANNFRKFIEEDERFEIAVESKMGLVCFRLKGENTLTEKLLGKLMARRKIYVIPGAYKDKFLIRFVVCSRYTIQDDIDFAWNEISTQASDIVKSINHQNGETISIPKLLQKPGEMTKKIKILEMDNDKQNSTFAIE
ncbi:aromatic-L-amino-acid decarboxylase-like [Trichogramma pretiosum]|uniref:aromatic-L-amino-acid decarboxylase-like n=1 Tax=Trichogramma pretiosum TaxID=7493 RepID=UPI0006C93E6D|nr:aromatic-L-amino-acid decarboxylase-like [Trichogramma pretiosum]